MYEERIKLTPQDTAVDRKIALLLLGLEKRLSATSVNEPLK
jgi:hypothetical protein